MESWDGLGTQLFIPSNSDRLVRPLPTNKGVVPSAPQKYRTENNCFGELFKIMQCIHDRKHLFLDLDLFLARFSPIRGIM